MSRYQHTKGQIKDNAIEALLHDPLFRQRVEKNKKGKGSYMRKGKHGNRGNWEASGKKVNHFFTTAAAGSSFFRFSLLISLIAIKMAKATIRKSKTF